MVARAAARGRLAPEAPGALVGVLGAGLAGVGLWARRDVRRALEQERIVSTPDATPAGRPVVTAAGSRSLAGVIRRNTLAATSGRTYSEIDPFVDEHGAPTAAAERAAKDERTGGPLENPEHALWVQSTTLQTALMQAYMAFRVAELTIAIGVALSAVGAGLAALGRRSSAT